MMRILLLSDTYSEHTEKWAISLAKRGITIGLFSFNKASYQWYDNIKNIELLYEPELNISGSSLKEKISYFKYLTVLKTKIKSFKPDILHAHYATSYGLIGRLSKFKPFVISVWGADVFDFPKKTMLHRLIFQYNLVGANLILSTSEVMKKEIQLYTKKNILVTPFGVDVNEFCKKTIVGKSKDVINIGTIKPIEEKYGIIYIIEAAKLLIERNKDKRYKFFLIGPSNNINYYRKNIESKGLLPYFEITGRIPFNEISYYHNLLDVFLNVSIDESESFGVAAVEAMACEKIVIVTDVGGLKEVVNNGEFGIVIPKKNTLALVDAIELVTNTTSTQAIEKAKKAREHVINLYSWTNNVEKMINIYKTLI